MSLDPIYLNDNSRSETCRLQPVGVLESLSNQKLYFRPSWISRPDDFVDVIMPNVPAPRLLPGWPKLGVLNALNISTRN